jgi:hypothetical protein
LNSKVDLDKKGDGNKKPEVKKDNYVEPVKNQEEIVE